MQGEHELKAFEGWESAKYRWKTRPEYSGKEERNKDRAQNGCKYPLQFDLTNEQADNIAEEVILKNLPTWLRRHYNIFIEIPLLDDQRITESVTAQHQYGRMLQQIAHNGLGIVTQDGCMVGMRANGYKKYGHQRVRIPLATITNRVETARKHIGGCCNWDHQHAKCCGIGLSHAHGYTQTQRKQWQK